ncbi:MAG: thioredoxin TrxC [Rhodospirillaceae bacterium]
MDKSVHVVCPHCGTVNRVLQERLADHGKCGKCKKPLFVRHPVVLTETTFAHHVDRSGLPVVVDFWAPWCAPCRAMAPHFEQAAAELEPRVRLAKLDTESAPGIAARYGIRSIPTLILFRDGVEKARHSGALDLPHLLRWVRSHL